MGGKLGEERIQYFEARMNLVGVPTGRNQTGGLPVSDVGQINREAEG